MEGRTVLSFYLDDTNPYVAPPEAFEEFLRFVSERDIAGESSVVLAMGGKGLLSEPRTEVERAFLGLVRRQFDCGLDAHMEIMTHWGLYDFTEKRMPLGAQHEGVWLYEPGVTVEEYERYFGSVLAEGAKAGVRFTGLTWPGCSCEACTRRYAELDRAGGRRVNPAVWQALLNLARAGRFRGRTVPCFVSGDVENYGARLRAADGPYAVYELIPNALDRLGSYDNDPAKADADHYITADGRGGRIVELVEQGAPYCLFYAHWQGVNPAGGVGWDAFRTVVDRVERFLGDRVVWMRPSAYTDTLRPG